MTRSSPQANFTFDMDMPEFEISETNLDLGRQGGAFDITQDEDDLVYKSTPQKHSNDILSPRISTAEVNRHFHGFSQNYDNQFDITEDSLDPSIELGRGRTRNLSAHYSRRATSSSSEDEKKSPSKVTNKTPKVKDGKYDFVIPSAYRDDDSFFKGMSNNNKVKSKKKETHHQDFDLPDITGLSSIFTDNNATSGLKRPPANKTSTSHKKIVSVPLDPDDQALFTAFGSFQKKVEQLENEKKKLLDRVGELESELKKLRSKSEQDSAKFQDMERKAKKYKSMAIALKDQQMQGQQQSSQEEYWKEQYDKLKQKAQLALKEKNDAYAKLKENRQLDENEDIFADDEPNQPKQHPAEEQPPPQQEKADEAAAQTSDYVSELRDIKALLAKVLEQKTGATHEQAPAKAEDAAEAEPDAQQENESEPVEDVSEAREEDDSVIESLLQLAEKLRLSKEKNVPSNKEPRQSVPSSKKTRESAEPQQRVESSTAKQTRAPRLFDRVLESLPPSCDICASAALTNTASPWNNTCGHSNQQQQNTTTSPPLRTSSAPPPTQSTNVNTNTEPHLNYDWYNEPTIRPASSAEDATRLILDVMGKEYAKLLEEYNLLANNYQEHNPAKHKKQRQDLMRRLKVLLDDMEVKSDQIYALYDLIADKNINVEDPEWIKEYDQQREHSSSNDENVIGIGKHEWIHT